MHMNGKGHFQCLYRESSRKDWQRDDVLGAPRLSHCRFWYRLKLIWMPVVHIWKRWLRWIRVHHIDRPWHPWCLQAKLWGLQRIVNAYEHSIATSSDLVYPHTRLTTFRATQNTTGDRWAWSYESNQKVGDTLIILRLIRSSSRRCKWGYWVHRRREYTDNWED